MIVFLAVPVVACGEDEPDPVPPRVRLAVTAPADAAVVDSDAVTVSGRVAPGGAEVRVLGKPVAPSGGRFSTEVPLEPGANVIDVSASAGGYRPDVAAIRVVRRMPVEIPAVEGEPADTAVDRLQSLGLRVEVQRGGGILDDLLGGELRVCGTDPEEGETVRPGTTVTVEVSKGC